MNKAIVLLAILALAAIFVFGCAKNDYQYPTGYAVQGQQNPQQGYVGGGCAVAPGDYGSLPVDVSELSVAA